MECRIEAIKKDPVALPGEAQAHLALDLIPRVQRPCPVLQRRIKR